MNYSIDEARAAARKCCELHTNRENETKYKQAVEKFINDVRGPNTGMTEEEKREVLYFFKHIK